MAKRVLRARQLPGRALLPVLIGLAFAPASHAEIKLTPSVTVRETWTDNVNLAPPESARSEFITELTPALTLVEKNQRMQFVASYQLSRFLYSDKYAPNLRDGSSQLQADLKARLVEDLLFLDASATRSQQPVSAFGPQLADNPYTDNNRTDVTTWRVSPYLAHRFGSTADLVARYTRDSVKSGREGYGNSNSDMANLVLSSTGERRIGWNLAYMYQNLRDDRTSDSSTSTLQAGLSWRVHPSLVLTGSGGYDKYDYDAPIGGTRGKSWSVGYQYTPSPRTSLSMSVGHRYFGKSRSLSALHRSRHTVWHITYDESVVTTRSQFLLPATVDTAGLLDRLFQSQFPDQELRRQAIAAYIRATGLPPALANDINYLSNRYMLQHQFLASGAFTGVRSSLVLSLYDTRRNALSSQQFDSQLLGNSQSSLNDNTRQRGAATTLSYRMSSRTNAYATADASRSVSLSTAARQTNRALRLGMNSQLQRRLLGTVELRRLQGSSDAGNQSYTENAISATLSMTL